MAILAATGTPGYELFVGTAGATIPVVSVFQRLYLLIKSEMAVPLTDPGDFVVVGSMDDFVNLFGSSDAIVLDSIEVYFANFSSGLHIARIEVSEFAVVKLTIDNTPATKTITINGTTINFAADSSPTAQELVTAAVRAVNDEENVNLEVEAEYYLNNDGTINYTDGLFRIRDKTYGGFTVSSAMADVEILARQAIASIAATAGAKTIVIEGTTISITPDADPTLQEVVVAMIAAINASGAINQKVFAETIKDGSGAPVYTDGQFKIIDISMKGFVVTAGSGTTVVSTVTVQAPENPQYWDWTAGLRKIPESQVGGVSMEDLPLGFLAVPQAFFQLENQFERTQVGNTVNEVCSTLGWAAFLDPGDPAIISHPRQAKTDAANYNAPQGHTGYFYPYFLNRDTDFVSPSVAIAAAALRRYQRRGIQEPPCGEECVLDQVASVQFALNQAQKVDLAEAKISINIYQQGYGAMPYDSLTRAVDPAFQFMHVRVILSSFERTLRNTLRASGLLHRSVDSAGRFYSKLRLTVTGVCDLFYEAGALYGDTPGQAYQVQADATIQDANNLESGIVRFNVFLVPVPIARQIKGFIYRVAIDTLAQSVAIESGQAVI